MTDYANNQTKQVIGYTWPVRDIADNIDSWQALHISTDKLFCARTDREVGKQLMDHDAALCEKAENRQ